MEGGHWIWQQDGARPYTAASTGAWLQENILKNIQPIDWSAKSRIVLNVMYDSIWSNALLQLRSHRMNIENI